MTGFTHEYLPLLIVNILVSTKRTTFSRETQVFNTVGDSSVITCKYKSAPQVI